jgi:Leucine-rich repeat (LRR) protein
MQRSGIKILTQRAIQNCRNLESLHLTWNEIEEIPKNIFEFNPKLNDINIDVNKMKRIDPEIFMNLNVSNFLTIGALPLETIAVNSFYNITIEQLTIYATNLTKVDKWFGENISIQKLLIRSSKISEIVEGALDPLKSLVVLNLSNNKFKMIKVSFFPNQMPNLNYLLFEHNLIDKIDKKIFEIMPNLKILSLKNNSCIDSNIHNVASGKTANTANLRICFENAMPKVNQSIKLHLGWR